MAKSPDKSRSSSKKPKDPARPTRAKAARPDAPATPDTLAELLFNPPDWTDQYYERGKTQEALDQIIDSAFYARSHHVGLVQIADLFPLLFRRSAELHDFGSEEKFDGELDRIARWVDQIATRLIPIAHRWPKRAKSDVGRWFGEVAPPALVALG